MKKLKEYWQRFRGGPDFSRNEVLDVKLEGHQLSLMLPSSNISTVEPAREVNFPFYQSDWFERNAKQDRQHKRVHIYTELWMYLPVGFMSSQYELGMLSLSVWLKKISPNKSIDCNNLQELGEHLFEEYDTYFNSPIIGDNYLGFNTQVVQDKCKELKEYAPDLSNKRIQEHTESALEARGFPNLNPYEIKNIKGNNWVYYIEHHLRKDTNSRYYCYPINSEYYLVIRFRYRVDLAQKFKLWKKHAEAAEKRIMESVKIESVEPLQIESQK